MKKLLIVFATAWGCLAGAAWGGNLDSSAGPGDPASSMPTLTDLYERLLTGAEGSSPSGTFVESPGGIPATGHTLTEVWGVVPVVDNTDGAAPAEVKAGKTFWGLRDDGSWGMQAGAAPPAYVYESGQTGCYDGGGTLIPCAGTGQDAALRPGLAWPNPRFTSNSDGTVTDNLTGLLWLQDANCSETVGGIARSTGALTWPEALTWSNTLASGNCGLTDGSVAGAWRLPSRAELLSLVALQYSTPALANTAGTGQWSSGDPFLSVPSGSFWSSSPYLNYPTYAWYVSLNDGYVYYAAGSNRYQVWPVRGGQ